MAQEIASQRTQQGKWASLVGIGCNLLLFAAKLAAGLVAGSIAMTADAVNNLADASSSVITLVGFHLASRPADEGHPYGHARYEYVAGMLVAVLVLVMGFELGKTSIGKIFAPDSVRIAAWQMAVLVLAIAAKAGMMLYYRSVAARIDSTALAAAAADSAGDMLVTGGVLLSALLAAAFGVQADGFVGLAVAAFILYSGARMMHDTLDPILGAAPSQQTAQSIARKILSYEGVLGTHDLMLHDYGPSRRFGSVHVEMDASVDVLWCHDMIDNIERDFLQEENLHLVIHYDPVVTGDAATGTKREMVQKLLEELSPQLSMHDFRMVAGPMHTNLIFDVVMPHGFALSEAELKKRIQSMVRERAAECEAVVTIDKSYVSVAE